MVNKWRLQNSETDDSIKLSGRDKGVKVGRNMPAIISNGDIFFGQKMPKYTGRNGDAFVDFLSKRDG